MIICFSVNIIRKGGKNKVFLFFGMKQLVFIEKSKGLFWISEVLLCNLLASCNDLEKSSETEHVLSRMEAFTLVCASCRLF